MKNSKCRRNVGVTESPFGTHNSKQLVLARIISGCKTHGRKFDESYKYA
jgi:hypothetical protein